MDKLIVLSKIVQRGVFGYLLAVEHVRLKYMARENVSLEVFYNIDFNVFYNISIQLLCNSL